MIKCNTKIIIKIFRKYNTSENGATGNLFNTNICIYVYVYMIIIQFNKGVGS